MATAMETFTRKQAGVIYRAVKEGRVEMSRQAISHMYDLVHDGPAVDWNGSANQDILGYHLAIEAIFSEDYGMAQRQIDRLAA